MRGGKVHREHVRHHLTTGIPHPSTMTIIMPIMVVQQSGIVIKEIMIDMQGNVLRIYVDVISLMRVMIPKFSHIGFPVWISLSIGITPDQDCIPIH